MDKAGYRFNNYSLTYAARDKHPVALLSVNLLLLRNNK